jgi:hypothetical protein
MCMTPRVGSMLSHNLVAEIADFPKLKPEVSVLWW